MTQSTPPSSWTETTIHGCLADEFPGAWGSEPGRSGPNAHILRSTNLDDDGHINFATAAKRWIDEPHLTQRRLRDGDVLLEASGGGPGKPVGRVAHFQAPDSIAYLSSNFFRTLRPDERKVHPRFLAWRLLDLYRQPRIWNFQQQTTGIINLKTKDYLEQRFRLPEIPEQSRIAAVLDTVDEAIAKTEAVTAKLRQVRAGLLHDLLTRGLDHNGQLRDPIAHPEQFQASPLGQIPKEWNVVPLAKSIATIFDYRGRTPLKINMEWGGGEIPALSAMNVEMGRINFEKETNFGSPALYDRWMTQGQTEQGDVLITMEAPLGNIAQIPDGNRYILSQRVVLLRPKSEILAKNYLAIQMSGTRFQKDLVKHSSGSTAVGIQRAKLELIEIAVPKRIDEQDAIALNIHAADNEIVAVECELTKLRYLKSGLMTDLLTGHVPVPANL